MNNFRISTHVGNAAVKIRPIIVREKRKQGQERRGTNNIKSSTWKKTNSGRRGIDAANGERVSRRVFLVRLKFRH